LCFVKPSSTTRTALISKTYSVQAVSSFLYIHIFINVYFRDPPEVWRILSRSFLHFISTWGM